MSSTPSGKPTGFKNHMDAGGTRLGTGRSRRAEPLNRPDGRAVRAKVDATAPRGLDEGVQAFKLYEKREAVWKRVEPALDVFRPDGQLNDRAWAKSKSRGLCPGS